MSATPIQVTTELNQILNRIEQKIDKINDRLTKLEIGQTKLEGDINALKEDVKEIKGSQKSQIWALITILATAMLGILVAGSISLKTARPPINFSIVYSNSNLD